MLQSDHRRELLIVGPARTEWKVLRDTDGERFVVMNKGHGF